MATLPKNIPITFPIEFIEIPKTNYRKGRTSVPDLIVIHVTVGSRASTISEFKNPTGKSTHLLVDKKGNIVQFVSTNDTAYGNGIMDNPINSIVLSRGAKNPNNYSISIEHEGSGKSDLTTVQFNASVKIITFLCKKWAIPADRTHIIMHREITEDKACPGLINVESLIHYVRKTLGIGKSTKLKKSAKKPIDSEVE